MVYLSRVLWMLPFAVHLGFGAAVFNHFPMHVGRTIERGGTPLVHFYALWFSTVAAADMVFVLLSLRMPHLKDRMFSVPSKAYWLSTPETRRELFSRLRGIIDAALLGLNVFFLAVFQAIYQANTVNPAISLNLPVLIVGFMIVPLLLLTAYLVAVILGLRVNREKE
jgi:hypothetical protein